MILKLLGCVTLLLMGGMGALTLVNLERKRLETLDGWIELIFHIRTRIDCYLTPIGEILATADTELLKPCQGVPTDRSLEALLQRGRFLLSPEANRLLTAFAREIGCSYREEQVKRCDYYADALRRLRDKEFDALPARLRVRCALCLCAAIGAAILLW